MTNHRPSSSSEVPVDPDISMKLLTPSEIKKVFIILFFTGLIGTFHQGILPAAAVEIQDEFDISDAAYGYIGSSSFFGRLFGAVFASKILDRYPAKYVLAANLAMLCFTLFLFTVFEQYSWLLFIRFSTGIFQIYIGIYVPVWVDAYGDKRMGPRWMTLFLVTVPLGVLVGYLIAAFTV